MKIVKKIILSRGWIPIVILLAANLVMIVIDFLSKAAISKVIDGASNKVLSTAVIGLGTIVLLKASHGILDSIFYNGYYKSLTKGIEVLMRDVYNKYLNISYSDDIDLSSGDMVNVMNNNISKVSDFVGDLIPALIENLVEMVSIVAFICSMSPVLVIYTIIMGTIYISGIYWFNTRFVELCKKLNSKREELNRAAIIYKDMGSYIRTHGLRKYASSKMGDEIHTFENHDFKTMNTIALQSNARTVFKGIFVCLWGLLGLKLYMKGDLTLGQFSTLFTVTSREFVRGLASLTYISTKFTSIKPSISAIEDVLKMDNEKNGDIKLNSKIDNIELDNITFGYDDSNIIENLSLRIDKNTSVALVGDSGSGKSTILGLIQNLNRIDSGHIRVNGIDLNDLELEDYRSRFAVVQQNAILFNGTIRDNLLFGLDHSKITESEINDAIKMSNLDEFINSLEDGLNTNIGEKGMKLSGGQKQRISIARAFLRDPEVVILDEATSALDSITEKEIKNAIANLMSNRITIAVAHRLSTIKDYDNIVVLGEKHIIEEGTFQQLMDLDGKFSKLWKSQV